MKVLKLWSNTSAQFHLLSISRKQNILSDLVLGNFQEGEALGHAITDLSGFVRWRHADSYFVP